MINITKGKQYIQIRPTTIEKLTEDMHNFLEEPSYIIEHQGKISFEKNKKDKKTILVCLNYYFDIVFEHLKND